MNVVASLQALIPHSMAVEIKLWSESVICVLTNYVQYLICRFLGLMPAFSRLSGGLGAKLVTVYPHNAEKGIPSHQGIVTVFDPSTGTLQAVRTCLEPSLCFFGSV